MAQIPVQYCRVRRQRTVIEQRRESTDGHEQDQHGVYHQGIYVALRAAQLKRNCQDEVDPRGQGKDAETSQRWYQPEAREYRAGDSPDRVGCVSNADCPRLLRLAD